MINLFVFLLTQDRSDIAEKISNQFINSLGNSKYKSLAWTAVNNFIPNCINHHRFKQYWNPRVVRMLSLSSQVAPEVVDMTTSGTANGYKVFIKGNIGLHWCYHHGYGAGSVSQTIFCRQFKFDSVAGHHQIATDFCTWHGSIAVAPCTKCF